MTDQSNSAPEDPNPGEESEADLRRRVDRLSAQAAHLGLGAEERKNKHAIVGHRLGIVAVTAAFAAAIGAGASTLTILTDHKTLAGILAMITLVVTSFNASYKPPERAGAHFSAVVKFRDVLWALNNLEEDLTRHTMRYVEDFRTDPATGATYDAGYYIPGRFQTKLLDNLTTRFHEVKEKYRAAINESPHINVSIQE